MPTYVTVDKRVRTKFRKLMLKYRRHNAFRLLGWEAFDKCPKCEARRGEMCVYLGDTLLWRDKPHKKRPLRTGVDHTLWQKIWEGAPNCKCG